MKVNSVLVNSNSGESIIYFSSHLFMQQSHIHSLKMVIAEVFMPQEKVNAIVYKLFSQRCLLGSGVKG